MKPVSLFTIVILVSAISCSWYGVRDGTRDEADTGYGEEKVEERDARSEGALRKKIPLGGLDLRSLRFYSNSSIKLAKMRLAEEEGAARIIEAAKDLAEPRISKSDSEIRSLLPVADNKRALMVHRKGCPVHGGGTMVYAPFGTTVDLNLPLKVRCPIGGEVYPNGISDAEDTCVRVSC